MFRAKGDQWGLITGNSLKVENPNLLTRTERMAHAVQVYLQRHGHAYFTDVEAVLLCSDPATNVDSMRPIIRVICAIRLKRLPFRLRRRRRVEPGIGFRDCQLPLTSPSSPASRPVETAPDEAGSTLPAQESDPSVPAVALPGFTAASLELPVRPVRAPTRSHPLLPYRACVPLVPHPDADHSRGEHGNHLVPHHGFSLSSS